MTTSQAALASPALTWLSTVDTSRNQATELHRSHATPLAHVHRQ